MKRILLIIAVIVCVMTTHITQAQVTWENLKGPYGGVIFDLEFTTSGDKYYALVTEYDYAYPSGELYQSIDNGVTWQPVNFSPTKEYASDVEVDNTGVYVVTGNNVYRSTDNGVTFTKLNTNALDQIIRIKRNPVTGTLIGAGHFKLYRSTNGGATWTLGYNLSSGGGAGSFLDLEINASGHIFISGGVGLVRSTDDGFSATSVATGLSDLQVMEIEMSKDGSTLFAHHRNGVQQAVDPSGSPLMGDTWTTPTGLSTSPNSSWDRHGVLTATDDSNIIFADDENNKVYSKTLAAAAWTLKGNLSVKTKSIAARSVNSFFVGTGQGIFATSNGGSSFTQSTDGIERVRYYSMVLTTTGKVVVSTGNKIHASANLYTSSPSWENFYLNNEFQYTPELFAMSDGSVLALGSTGLRSNTTVTSWPTTYTTPANTYLYARQNTTAFFGVSNDGKIYYSNTSGASWSVANVSITGLPASYQVRELATSGTNNRLFLTVYNSGTNANELYRIAYTLSGSEPTAASATLISSGTFTGYTLVDVEDVKTLGNTVYVIGRNNSQSRLARSSDGGTTWTTITVPGGNKLAVTANGYIFILQYDTFYVSRDNGTSFQGYTFNNSGGSFDLAGLDLDSEGRAFLVQNYTGLHYTNETMVLPPAPTTPQLAGRADKEVTLRWTDNATDETIYIIEREGTNGYDSIGYNNGVYLSGKKGYFRDIGLQPSTSYNYRIRAKNSAGYSAYVNLTVSTTNTCTSTIPVNRSWAASFVEGGGTPVTNAQVVSLGNGQFSVDNLDLGLYSGQTGYFYESCGETYLFATQGGGTQLEPNTNGTWNGTNTITVKWITNDNNPEVAKTLRLILNATDPTPASPTGVSASILNNTTMEVRWIGSAFETQYVIERSTTSGAGFTEIATVNYPTRTYLDNTVALNTNYYYRVKARNTTGTSAASAESTVVNFKRPNFILAANSVTAATGNTGGTLWGDIDNDGDEDLIIIPFDFFSSELNTPSVFRNEGSGNFTNVDVGFELSKYAAGTMADYDNDGNLDIYFTTFNNVNKLYKGAGNFSFTSVTGTPLTFPAGDFDDSSFAPIWIDYNKDGRLDLFIVKESKQNLLFKQNTDGTFSQETTGLLATSIIHGIDATWVDYDNDGDMDVFFINGEDNNTFTNNPCLLYSNNGDGTFTNLASAGFDLSSNANNSISAAWGDYNNDGFLDVFVANQETEPTSTNYLYRNNGNGTFTKQTTSLIMETQTTGTFGGAWGDINNDGLLDLLLAKPGKNIIYLNQGSAFTKVITEKFNDPFYSNLSLSLADYNKDGLLDLAVGNNDPNLFSDGGAPNSVGVNNLLFLNNNTPGNYIQLRLTGTVSNRSAIGARVVIRTGTSTFQHRQVLGRTSFLSQNSNILHFGLGAATTVASIEVRWPSGIIQTLTNVPANGIVEIIEDNTGPVITQLSPLNTATDINANTTLAVTFNEATNAVASRNLRIFKTTDLVNAVATVAVTSAVKTGNTFTFTLAQKLENSTSYSVSIEAGAFEDIYGNDFTGLATSAWQFTTIAGPATTLLSPANNANNVAVNTTLEITFNKAVTGVAGKSVDVLIQGSDAPEFSIDAATGTIAGNKITFTLPETLAFQTLYDVEVEAGAFVDNFSNASNLITWSFLTVDNIAPVINFTAPASINKGTATTLSPLITDNSGEIGTAVLHYRKISASTFSTLAGSISASVANQFDFAVPTTFFDETGLEYYFTATDLSGNEVRSPAGTSTHKLLVRYSLDDSEIPSAQLGFGGAKANWKIFSVPFELGNNNSVNSIFDELSDLENKIDYRLLKYKDQTGWGEFPSDFSTITRGEGYFINIKVAEDIRISEGILAPSNDRNNLFTLNLKQGWNMIGNPYLSTISWADVSAYNALTGTNAVLVKYTSGQYVQTNQNLLPFEGGLVFASAAATISIPFAGQTSATTRQDEVIFSESDWLMPLTIMNGEVENTFGGIGMHTMANESFDQFDGVNPPRFFEFSELNFAHPEHFAKNFARDVVPTSDKYMWEFTVSTNQSGSATLTWDNSGLTNIKQQLYLFDEEMQQPIDMHTQSQYTFNPKASSRFRIYYGDNILNEMLPNMFQLGKAYPNPSAGVVSLPFSLPEAGGTQQQVAIEVIDAMGKNLGTILEKSYAPGLHTFEWNGANVINSQSLYIFKVMVDNEQGKQIQQTRILINK